MVEVKLQGVEKMHDEEDCLNNSDNSIHNSKFDSMFNIRVHCIFSIVCARVKEYSQETGQKLPCTS